MSPQLHNVKIDGLQNIKPEQLLDKSLYKRRKNKFLIVTHILDSDDRWTDSEKQKLVGAICDQDELQAVLPGWLVDKKGKSTSLFGNFRQTVAGIVSANDPFQEVVRHAKAAVAPYQVSDITFITQLPVMCDKEPLLVEAAVRIGQIVWDNLKQMVKNAVHKVYAELHRTESESGQQFNQWYRRIIGQATYHTALIRNFDTASPVWSMDDLDLSAQANSREELITLFGYSMTGIVAEVAETIKNIKANAVSPTGQQKDDAEGTTHEPVVSFVKREDFALAGPRC
ncbi:hypothetical protein JB92DRAFT_3126267 [Gautieria morchelliformis]|nr:hypothetical protein JB92DRAFT_3126267 [Gautieria morchelliformis]